MPGTIENISKDVIDPVQKVAMLPLDIAAATLGIDAMRGKNPVAHIAQSTRDAALGILTMPFAVARDGIIGVTKLALGTLASAVTGTAKAAGNIVLNAPIIPTGRR